MVFETHEVLVPEIHSFDLFQSVARVVVDLELKGEDEIGAERSFLIDGVTLDYGWVDGRWGVLFTEDALERLEVFDKFGDISEDEWRYLVQLGLDNQLELLESDMQDSVDAEMSLMLIKRDFEMFSSEIA